MTILVFTTDYPPESGGIATYSYEIAKALSSSVDVIVLAPHLRGDDRIDQQTGIKTIRVINWPWVREFFFFFLLLYIIKKYRVDRILNPVWFPCGAMSFLVTRIIRVPYFVSAHASEILDDKLTIKRRIKEKLKWLKLLTFRYAEKVFAVSSYTKERLVEMNVPSRKVTVINNGADEKKYRPDVDCSEVIENYNLKNKKVLLTVARLDEHKGHDMVIKSLPHVLKYITNLTYLIVGEGVERTRLEILAKKMGLEHVVQFAGHVQDEKLVSIYNVCNVFIMPSREIPGRSDLIEGFGISLIEANACGKPVIAGKSGGIEDAVIDDETGILVDPLSVDEISTSILKLLTDEDHGKKLGLQGRKRVEESLNWNNIGRRIKEAMD